MDKELYRIRVAVENIYQLMEALVAKQMDFRQCCRAVALPVEQTADQPTGTGSPGPEMLYNRKEAAAFLMVDPRTVTRYRIDGKLRFVYNEDNRIRYREEDLSVCYFWKWGKRPSGYTSAV